MLVIRTPEIVNVPPMMLVGSKTTTEIFRLDDLGNYVGTYDAGGMVGTKPVVCCAGNVIFRFYDGGGRVSFDGMNTWRDIVGMNVTDVRGVLNTGAGILVYGFSGFSQSADGINFADRVLPIAGAISGVKAGNYVMFAEVGLVNTLAVSDDDAATFTAQTALASGIISIQYNGFYFIASGLGPNIVQRSFTGLSGSWQDVSGPFTNPVNRMGCDNIEDILACSTGIPEVAYSPLDGDVWLEGVPPPVAMRFPDSDGYMIWNYRNDAYYAVANVGPGEPSYDVFRTTNGLGSWGTPYTNFDVELSSLAMVPSRDT